LKLLISRSSVRKKPPASQLMSAISRSPVATRSCEACQTRLRVVTSKRMSGVRSVSFLAFESKRLNPEVAWIWKFSNSKRLRSRVPIVVTVSLPSRLKSPR
jgi:hypothetical protein